MSAGCSETGYRRKEQARLWWLVAIVLATGTARADAPAPPRASVPLFSITKSENKNQIAYALYVDENCAPASGAPVFAYWKMFEKGPTRTAPMLSREAKAYGLVAQRVDGEKVRIALKAVPSKPIVIETSRGAQGACQALSTTTIAGVPAHLFDVYVRLKGIFGVDDLLLRGWSMDGKAVVQEKVTR